MDRLPHEREGKEVTPEELLEVGRKVLRSEAEVLLENADSMDFVMVEAAKSIQYCKGRLVVAGLGKSGLIGRKIAATFASLGTPAFFLHASEGAHGDLGMVCREDVGLFLSNSGETREVLELLPYFRRLGATVIAMTGNPASRLAREADLVLCSRVEREADPLGLAPTSSTTLQLALGDALAGMVTEMRGLRREDFALFHPGGSLGRRLLLRVRDVMGGADRLPLVREGASVKEALFSITSKGYGATLVVNGSGELRGIFTDGDLRRLVEDRGAEAFELSVETVMTLSPRVIAPDKLAAEAVLLMEQHEVSVLVVAEGARPVGMVHLHDLLKAGVA
ncbi:MAG TPA: KpsF/GutQ family sugar-phosphate isomerase [Synergistaceae bacterium]|nr:KpsF/GutQ family sugar-phosphate isomerase [Synergistaceae bacterium]HPJ24659.1 KpsF/GutQ family sugar-phosphate isomerase [Synergistaceae bacterium]HPQ37059.1 KpsF/GutQ family sugar-phosphate isomerase [Synergistaceae bacterium]